MRCEKWLDEVRKYLANLGRVLKGQCEAQMSSNDN